MTELFTRHAESSATAPTNCSTPVAKSSLSSQTTSQSVQLSSDLVESAPNIVSNQAPASDSLPCPSILNRPRSSLLPIPVFIYQKSNSLQYQETPTRNYNLRSSKNFN